MALARAAFDSGRTRPVEWREAQLDGLVALLRKEERTLLDAMHEDLGKPRFEGWVTDIGVLITEFEYIRKRLDRYLRPRRVRVPAFMQPAKAEIMLEPLGVVLVISPWNYPVNLALSPLAAAAAAGNAVVLKPSEYSGFTSGALADLIPQYLDGEAIRVVNGDAEVAQQLLAQPLDHVMFTGSPRVGSLVMKAAAEHLTPVTLELGVKSPAIVHPSADLTVTARRIAFGKLMNAGQTCIAPDYVLVDAGNRDELVDRLTDAIGKLTGGDALRSPDYGRIISDWHWGRLMGLLPEEGVVLGGSGDRDSRFIEPTLVIDPPLDAPIMQEEIFGPILPILSVENVEAAITFVNARPKPLVLYIFGSNDEAIDLVNERTSSGATSINQTMYHAGIPELPFGGVGTSGTGRYRGLAGVSTFSNHKSVLRKKLTPDPGVGYPPYGRVAKRLLKRLI